MKLSKRLQRVADYIPKGCSVADIGSDHAFLPVYLVENNIAELAIAGEVNQGPFDAARRTVRENGYEQRIKVRKGDGLEVIEPAEVDIVTINGMGGGTIIDILAKDKEKTSKIKRLVLQPMVDSEQLRRWLHDQRWSIVNEDLVLDDGILYEIIVAEHGEEHYADSLWYEIGSLQHLEHNPLLALKIEGLIDKINRALSGLEKAKSMEAKTKSTELVRKKERLEEVLKLATEHS